MVSLDGNSIAASMFGEVIANQGARRAYGTTKVKTRLHQQGFRERVMRANREHCAMCRLRHKKLLDAAHIIPDSEPGGEAVVDNGLSLCKIHHATFDARVIGIDPDSLQIMVRRDVLQEVDGPMLRHGIQAMDGTKIWLPQRRKDRPDPERLAKRFEHFLRAG